ncbi:MAG: hypothetical protein ABII82_02785, partial [Verrucomicrobiota bacterium]
LADGLPVPLEVLADYPDLATPPKKAPMKKAADAVPTAERAAKVPPPAPPAAQSTPRPQWGDASARYPTIAAYMNGDLGPALGKMRDSIIASDPKMSDNRAKEVAAATLFAAIQDEGKRLEKEVRQHDAGGDMPSGLVSFYDDYVDARDRKTPSQELIELSGSRTLLADADAVVLPLPAASSAPLDPERPRYQVDTGTHYQQKQEGQTDAETTAANQAERPSRALPGAGQRAPRLLPASREAATRDLAAFQRAAATEGGVPAADLAAFGQLAVSEALLRHPDWADIRDELGRMGLTALPVVGLPNAHGVYYSGYVLIDETAEDPRSVADHEVFHRLVRHGDPQALLVMRAIDPKSGAVRQFRRAVERVRPGYFSAEADPDGLVAEEIAANLFAGRTWIWTPGGRIDLRKAVKPDAGVPELTGRLHERVAGQVERGGVEGARGPPRFELAEAAGATSPAEIKSSTGNVGTFNASAPDIRYDTDINAAAPEFAPVRVNADLVNDAMRTMQEPPSGEIGRRAWQSAMLEKHGEGIRPYLPQLWNFLNRQRAAYLETGTVPGDAVAKLARRMERDRPKLEARERRQQLRDQVRVASGHTGKAVREKVREAVGEARRTERASVIAKERERSAARVAAMREREAKHLEKAKARREGLAEKYETRFGAYRAMVAALRKHRRDIARMNTELRKFVTGWIPPSRRTQKILSLMDRPVRAG